MNINKERLLEKINNYTSGVKFDGVNRYHEGWWNAVNKMIEFIEKEQECDDKNKLYIVKWLNFEFDECMEITVAETENDAIEKVAIKNLSEGINEIMATELDVVNNYKILLERIEQL